MDEFWGGSDGFFGWFGNGLCGLWMIYGLSGRMANIFEVLVLELFKNSDKLDF